MYLCDPDIVCSLHVLVTSVLEIIFLLFKHFLCCTDDGRVNSGALMLNKECASCSILGTRYCSGMGSHDSKARSTCSYSLGGGVMYCAHLAKTICGVLKAPGQESGIKDFSDQDRPRYRDERGVEAV